MSVEVEIRMGALRFITLQNKEGRNALLFNVRKREKRIFITGEGKGVTR